MTGDSSTAAQDGRVFTAQAVKMRPIWPVVLETTSTVYPYRCLLVDAMGLNFHSSNSSKTGFKVLGSFLALKSSNKCEFWASSSPQIMDLKIRRKIINQHNFIKRNVKM